MDKPPGLLAAVLDMIRMVLYHINASYLIASEAFNAPINGLLQIIYCRISSGKEFHIAGAAIVNFVYLLSYEIYKNPEISHFFLFPDQCLPFDILLEYLQDEVLLEN